MAKVPESTKSSLQQRLANRARERWPALERISVTHRPGFADVTAHLTDGEELPLCRLRYGGSASSWGFAIYRASHDDCEPSYLPNGDPQAHPKTPSTAPAASTSTTPAPGSHPRRTNGGNH